MRTCPRWTHGQFYGREMPARCTLKPRHEGDCDFGPARWVWWHSSGASPSLLKAEEVIALARAVPDADELRKRPGSVLYGEPLSEPQAHYPLDDVGPVARDVSGNENHGTYSNGRCVVPAEVAAKVAEAFKAYETEPYGDIALNRHRAAGIATHTVLAELERAAEDGLVTIQMEA